MADKKDLKISIKINLDEIIADALFTGKKGQYLDATVYLKSEPDQYGNSGMITQDKTKELTANGKNQIIGNIKVWNDSAKKPVDGNSPNSSGISEPVDDLPF